MNTIVLSLEDIKTMSFEERVGVVRSFETLCALTDDVCTRDTCFGCVKYRRWQYSHRW